MDNSTSSGPSERSSSHHHHSKQSSQINGGGPRRPQTLSSPIDQKHLIPHQIQHILTVHKDSNGYGMKVSGDKPVFVESVKAGGASMKAGLIAGDMILKVNGIQVQSSTHTEVVQLIKSSPIVELTVQRGHKMRPSSLSAGQSTPLAQRGGITAPLPVDREKRRQMEVEKRHTLRLMLEQEKKNLENLESSSSNNRLGKTKAEATIRALEDQLRQVGGEDSSFQLISPPQPLPTAIIYSPPQQHHSTPAFLSRFPRSLSSLSIGTKKKSTEKENSSPSSANLLSSSEYHTHISQLPVDQQVSPSKKKMSGSERNLKQDIPPPLPQRNAPRKSLPSDGNPHDDIVLRRSGTLMNETMISDLDHSISSPVSSYHNVGSNNNSPQPGKNKKRTKTKIKALSDPKMSSQMFIDFEMSASGAGEPPPLPPRQPGMMEENLSSSNGSNKLGSKCSLNSARPLPNSIDTMMNYPLISTCTTVRDNMFNPAAFPLSHRPNIVQQLQQQQQQQQQHQQRQQQHHHHKSSSSSSAKNSTTFGSTSIPQMNQLSSKHRRVVSSPEALHSRGSLEHPERMNKSGSWELVEKDTEETPPGTPPPPYLSSHLSNMSGCGDGMTNNNTNNSNNQLNDDNLLGENFDSAIIGSNAYSASNPISAAQANIAQKQIISMEDDEMSDQESFIDDSGAFKSLSKLLEQENTAHLAVFLNYVMTNSDPSALLFYLITGLYKEGSVKDMRKWAYEIHSTFLVPRAPLLLSNVDEPLAREVDDVLQHEYEKGEILRKIFWKSRVKAKDFVNHQLQEFSGKRIAGLGAFFGPPDQVLLEARGDKTKEQKIIEETLIPKLQQMVDELDKETPNECPKKSAMCSALSTVLHRIFVTRANPGNPIDKVHHFVSREKSFKSRLLGKNRKILVRGHHLILRQYYEVTHCNHCQNIIWGVSPQGYFCTDCELNIHRACTKVVEENCPGPAPSKKVKDQSNENNKIRNFMEKIRPTNHLIQSERSRRQEEDGSFDDSFERPATQPVTRQSSDRAPDVNNSISSNNALSGGGVTPSDVITPPSLDTDSNAQDAEREHTRNSQKIEEENIVEETITVAAATSSSEKRSNYNKNRSTSLPMQYGDGNHMKNVCYSPEDVLGIETFLLATTSEYVHKAKQFARGIQRFKQQYSKPKSAPVSVNRSESYKETISQKRNRNNRRKTSDPSLTKVSTDEQVDLGLSNANLTQSSNSSLSSSLESTSTSLEAVGAPTAGTGTVPTARQQWIDSDEEHAGEINEVDWSSNVDAHILKTLTDQEKKRQEIINEIYITERNHVRTLKLLDGIFLKPLKESNLINSDFLNLLFPPALSTLKELHMQFESKIKQRRNDSSPLVSSIGDIIIEMFDGHIGEELKDFSAQFCCRQGVALEALKEKRRKDENLHKLLSKQESHRACRRLQLKDLLPTVLQRLTKYPLLFESLYKITLQVLPDNEQEQLAIKKSLENSKQILDHVNQAVRIADNSHKLQTIQRKLDKSSYEKEASNEFKNLDLTQHKLVHDGPLIMKKNPGTQLHGLLFENMMVLLHKQEERYVLKYHSVPMAGSNDNKTEIRFNPITKIHLLLIRQSAVDKNTFFLINTNVSQMLELTAPSKSECKIWFKHISDAAESYKARTRGNSHEHNDDGHLGANQKDSFESSALDHSQPPPTPIITPEPIQNSNLLNIKNSQDSNENLNNNNSVNNNQNNIYENNQIINSNISNDCSSSKTDINIHEDDDDGDDNSDNEDDKIIGDTNSNETRTLTQQCSLVAPCEVQININPAHTAEPVITPAERLRRLDDSIRTTLMEKQRIVCDMFRVPNEHFEAIADIAGQPEASKKTSFQEPSDIVLAAFAQVQSLTEILNECIKVTTHQEISAVSTSLCDVCYRGQKEIKMKTNTCVAMTTAASTTNKISHLLEKGSHVLVEDEDGYCEIDELRIPTIPSLRVTPTNFPPLPPVETTTPITPTSPTTVISNQSPTNTNMPNTQANINDAKRQSTVSADSIPEETEHEINALLPPSIEIPNESEYSFCDTNEVEQNTSSSSLNNSNMNNNSNNDDFIVDDDVPTINNSYSNILNPSESHNIECINDTYDSASQMSELNQDDESTLRSQSQETQRLADNLMELCGTNRLAHVQSLVPSIPCHLITGYVTMLNEQITRLLPKLEERDVERDQLRKENQHLRELLNSKYEKERVSESDETLLIDNNSSFDEPQTSQQKHSQKEDPNSLPLSTE